ERRILSDLLVSCARNSSQNSAAQTHIRSVVVVGHSYDYDLLLRLATAPLGRRTSANYFRRRTLADHGVVHRRGTLARVRSDAAVRGALVPAQERVQRIPRLPAGDHDHGI